MLAAIYVYTISPDPYKSFINARGNKVSPFLSSNDSVALSSGERSGFIRKRSYAEIENLFDRISSTSEVLVRDIKIGRGFALFSEYLPSLKQSRMDSCKKEGTSFLRHSVTEVSSCRPVGSSSEVGWL